MKVSLASLVTFDGLFVMFCGQNVFRPFIDVKVVDGDGERIVRVQLLGIVPASREMATLTDKWVLVVEVVEDPADKLTGKMLRGRT